MSSTPPSSPAVAAPSVDRPRGPAASEDELVSRFHAAYCDAVDAGCEQPLPVWLARFPGADARIAREFAALEAERVEAEHAELEPTQPLVPVDAAGTRFGAYRLLARLGAGGQGEVFLAEDEQLGRRVALKLLRDRSAGALRRFAREAQAASRLDLPGICTVYGTGVVDGQPYLAMRFVPGCTLAAAIRAAREAGQQSVDIGTQVCGASGDRRRALHRLLRFFASCARTLHAAHEAGLVHRDVKPANVMVSETGEPVLLDFGLARDADGAGASLSLMCGTPEYMSPEQLDPRRQARGTGHLDRRTDVYSLAVSLFECLTLRLPFDGIDWRTRYSRIMDGTPPDPRSTRSWLPRELSLVLHKALQKDPADRYATAAELADELDRIVAGVPVRVRRASPWTRLRKWARRNPMACAFVVLLAGSLAAVSLSLARAEAATRTEQRLRREAEQRATDEAVAAARAELRGGRYGEAIEAFAELERAGRLDAVSAAVFRADALAGLLRYDDARALLATLPADIAGAPAGGRAFVLRAELALSFPVRRADVDARAASFEPADLHYARALTAADLPELTAELDAVLALEPGHRRALRSRALAHLATGRHRAAAADLHAVLALFPHDPAATAILAVLAAVAPEATGELGDVAATVDPSLRDFVQCMRALASAAGKVVDLGVSELLPRADRLGALAALELAKAQAEALVATARVEANGGGEGFRVPAAIVRSFTPLLRLVFRPTRERAERVLAERDEPLAHFLLGCADADAGDLAATCERFERALAHGGVFGVGCGVRYAVFCQAARIAARTDDPSLRDRLAAIAREAAAALAADAATSPSWLAATRRVAAATDLGDVCELVDATRWVRDGAARDGAARDGAARDGAVRGR
ncbi:MAG: protein kinase [Planctomycetes bacterium]|nr:protein kinase [Planctomycetota bacterium]